MAPAFFIKLFNAASDVLLVDTCFCKHARADSQTTIARREEAA